MVDSIFESLASFITRLITIFLFFACLQKVSWWGHPLYHDRRGPPAVPYLIPWFGSAFAFYYDFLAFINHWSNHFKSDIFACYLNGFPTLVVTDPFAAQFLISGRIRQLRWGDILFNIMHKSIGLSEEVARLLTGSKAWNMTYQKNLMNHKNLEKEILKVQDTMMTNTLPALLPSSYGTLEKECSNGCNEWVQLRILEHFGQQVFMTTITWLLGTSSFSTRENYETLLMFNDKILTFLRTPSYLIPFYREAYNAREKLVSELETILSDSLPNEKSNGLGELMKGVESVAMNNGVSSLEERAKIALCIVVAATINAVPTTFWVMYHILSDQDAYQEIQEEIFGILDEKLKSQVPENSPLSPEKRFSLQDLDKMLKLESLITEVLRFRSTRKVLRKRVADEDLELKLEINGEISQFNVKKGTMIVTCPALMHFDEEIFENAGIFNWKRFLPRKDGEPLIFKKNGIPISNPVQAFGGGTTLCPGRKFAKAEIKLIVASFLADHDMRFSRQGISKPPGISNDCTSGMPTHDVSIEVRKRDCFP